MEQDDKNQPVIELQGVWKIFGESANEALKDISKNWHLDKKFSPKMKNNSRTKLIKGWSKAIKRTLIN